jgi:membrane carboxypeptidase/penicillin-binding protein
MSRYYAATKRPADSWTPPADVVTGELDRVTGEMANEETPPDRIYTEYFIEGTEPIPLRPELVRFFPSGPVIR